MESATSSHDDRDSVKKLREEAKSICQKLQKYGEESFFLSANVSNKLSNFSGSSVGVMFLTNRLNIIKDFYTFCIAKSLEDKSDINQPEETLIKQALEINSSDEPYSHKKTSGDNEKKCALCPKVYKSNRSLQQHIKAVHSTKPFSCDLCGKKFYTQEDIKIHKTMHGIGQKQFKCHLCEKRFGRKRSLNRHLKLHQGGKIYHCKHCDIKFIDFKAFKRHHLKHSLNTYRSRLIKSRALIAGGSGPSKTGSGPSKAGSLIKNKSLPKHAKGKKSVKTEKIKNGESSPDKSTLSIKTEQSPESADGLTCDICNKTFANKSGLQLHLATHIETAPSYSCDECTKSFMTKSGLQKHKAVHAQDLLRCKKCKRKCKNESVLNLHEKMCGLCKDKVNCDVCQEKFLTIYELETHKKTKHQDEFPFVCEICGESFKQKYLLTRHKNILCKREAGSHGSETEAMFKCNDCGTQFEDAAAVQKHIEEKGAENLPYKCQKCCKRFATQRILKRHEDTHNSGLYKCDFCEKTFVTVGGLEQHMDSEPHFKFICGTCGKKFETSKELKAHSRIHG